VKIARALLDQMIEHARAEAPNECCGMVAARDGSAVEVFPMRNVSRSPRFAYEMDPKEQLQVETNTIDERGDDLGAIYHSHPRTDPEPSQTDMNLAEHPHALYIIIGHAASDPVVRTWRIVKQRDERGEVTGVDVSEAELHVA
jgi:[CysO sulfur-carrier protein]-S-L-cysteine hydrolase